MTLQSTDYALLSQASYKDPEVESRSASGVTYKRIEIGGEWYRPIAHTDNPHTGFQATAYEKLDGSHEIVIAYRGTEFDREPSHDGTVDAGMAIAGVNAQTPDAEAFTQRVIELAKQRADFGHYTPNITVTGHSLGGTLAEEMAYKHGLHGETFNAFGAAGLHMGIPKGGSQVVDHVRATDVVSAASSHFGQVRVYGTQQDLDALEKAGFHDSLVLSALDSYGPFLGKSQSDAHAIDNFVPDSKLLGQSIISSENEKRAQAHHTILIP